jgi:hypothetical protein
MSPFQWLNDFFQFIFRFFPRLTIVPVTHGGVAFVRGKPRLIRSGRLYWWWPLWTKALIVPTARQTLNLPSQVLVPQGDSGKPLIVSGVVVYDIRDPLVALSNVHDLDDAIRDMGLVAIKKVLLLHTLEEIREKADDVDALLLKEMESQLSGWGVRVQQFFLSDVAPGLVIRTMGEEKVHYVPEVDEDQRS